MALKAPSPKADTSPLHNTQSHYKSSRVTRSATRRAVDSPPTAASQANHSPPQPAPQASRKRKDRPEHDPNSERTPTTGHSNSSSGRSVKKPKLSASATSALPPSRSQKKPSKTQPSMAKPGYDLSIPGMSSPLTNSRPSNAGDKENEKSPTIVPETSKRKASRSKKTNHGRSRKTVQDDSANTKLDIDQPTQPSASSGRRPKKSSTRKSDDPVPKGENEAHKPSPKPNNEPLRTGSMSEDDTPPRDLNDDDDDALSAALRSGIFPHGRSHAEMSATLRSLQGYTSSVSSRMREMLNNLRQKADPSVQLIALQELSELLLISNEDNLSGQFSPDQFVKELIGLMQPEDFVEANPEMMLLACRCIANMMEALPTTTPVVVYGGAVPVLCQKLLEIDFIDLAEQALSTLEKISVEFPSSIVREGGLSACLNFLDFFATSTQRTAVTTAANCCKNIPHDSFSVICDVMPTLLNVLSNSDQKVVEQGSICVSRIIESFRFDNAKIEQLVSVDLLKAIKRLLHPGTTNLIGPNIHTQFLRVLTISAQASPNLSAELLKMEVVDTLYQILTGVSPPTALDDAAAHIDSVFIMQALIHRPREQITETLNVVCEILPPVQTDHLSFKADSGDSAAVHGGMLPRPGTETRDSNQKRLDVLQNCREELRRFAIVMFPTLTDAFSSTVNLAVRQKVLAAQLKMLSNLDVSILEDSLRTVPYASFLASILSQKDHPSLVCAAIHAADLLLNRLVKVYGYQFYREGVMAEVTKLANEAVEVLENKAKSTKDTIQQPPVTVNGTHEGDLPILDEPLETDSQIDHEVISADSDDHDDEDDDEDDNDEVERSHHIREDASPSPSDSSSEIEYLASTTSEHDLNVLSARKFLGAHENSKAMTMKNKANKILNQLQKLAQAISEHYVGGGQGNGLKLFTDLSHNFNGDALGTVTSAELLQSEIVDTLLDVFNNSEEDVRTKARADFLQIFMLAPSPSSHSQPPTAFNVFIHKLQDLLSRAEHFEVVTVHHNAFDNSRSSPYNMLSKQLKMRLAAEDESEIPRSYHSLTISVHAIATFKSLDDYLRPRISLSERPKGSRHRDGITSTLAAFAAAAGLPHPHHRPHARPSFPTDLSTQSPPSDGPSSSKAFRKALRATKDELAPDTTPDGGKSTAARRSSRRKQTNSPDSPDMPAPPPERVQTPLECADQHQLTDDDDDDDPEDSSALDAFVDDLEDSMDGERASEPSAVTMEVAATGKVTARKEDGTRIASPQSSSAGPPAPQQRLPGSRRSDMSSHVGFAASRAMTYAAAIQAIPQDWHVEFSIDGHSIPHDMTIYQAIHRENAKGPSHAPHNIWSAIHTVKFKRASGPPPAESSLASKASSSALKESSMSPLPASLHEHPQTSKILRLLNIFHEMNSNLDDVLVDKDDRIALKAEALSQFVNTKLTAKLNRQLEEPLIVASNCLPKWSEDLARLYPFLFPFETRHLFLQSSSFGYSRSMARWQNQSTEDTRRDRRRDDRPFSGKLQRQKVRIQRSRVLESACKVMEIYGGSPSILEIEYFDEVGTGLGPTLEFYSTVSKEFSKKKTGLWRGNDSNDSDQYAFGKNGMFPAPMTKTLAEGENGKKILYYFKMLGKFVARSMLDGRIIDVSLNPIFFRVGNQPSTVPLSLGAVKNVDEHLANSLRLLKQYATAKQSIQANRRLSAGQQNREIRKVTINNAAIDDLSLDFTLPGYPDIELEKDGANLSVNMENISLYIDRVIDMTLGSGVQRQVDAFRAGFSEVFPYSALRAFTPSELVMLFGRTEEDWSLETLCDSIKADHGYNMDSRSVRNLLQVMSELTLAERRDFLQFVTGSPKLPIGGFKSLNPMFTVVCRPSEAPYTSDDFLISVMTCQNYVKLPDYSDMDVLRQRLLKAITEGQGAFHLS